MTRKPFTARGFARAFADSLDWKSLAAAAGVDFPPDGRDKILEAANLFLVERAETDSRPTWAELRGQAEKTAKCLESAAACLDYSDPLAYAVAFQIWPDSPAFPGCGEPTKARDWPADWPADKRAKAEAHLAKLLSQTGPPPGAVANGPPRFPSAGDLHGIVSLLAANSRKLAKSIRPGTGQGRESRPPELERLVVGVHAVWRAAGGKGRGAYSDDANNKPAGDFFHLCVQLLKQLGELAHGDDEAFLEPERQGLLKLMKVIPAD